jgi:hypothetical protein
MSFLTPPRGGEGFPGAQNTRGETSPPLGTPGGGGGGVSGGGITLQAKEKGRSG